MVRIMLEAGVNDAIVRRDEAMLIPTVKVDTIGVEEQAKLNKQQVHVDRH